MNRFLPYREMMLMWVFYLSVGICQSSTLFFHEAARRLNKSDSVEWANPLLIECFLVRNVLNPTTKFVITHVRCVGVFKIVAVAVFHSDFVLHVGILPFVVWLVKPS